MYSSDSGNANASSYTKDNLISRYRIAGNKTVDYTYDGLNRLTKKVISTTNPVNVNYTYRTSVLGDAYRTTQVETEKIADITYKYSYDKEGNITGITKDSGAYRSYTYDGKNQLTKEINNTTGITTNFTYDAIGNITKKVQSGNVSKTIKYRYGNDGNDGWNKLLTGVDLSGNDAFESAETISYDAIGNPTSYLGASLSWYGRQLKSSTKGSTSNSYTYDADGLRGTKTVNGTKSTYHYVGGQLRYEARGAQKFYYFYDAGGNLSAIRYRDANGNASIYYAVTNIQGDVVRFYNSAGTIVASYQYDAFGNCTITRDDAGIAALNPIRYRGYYYDSETGLYYLQSRYYNPQVGRFLNADGFVTTGQGVLSYNMFAYCQNNPVMFSDPSGEITLITLLGCVLVGVVTLVVVATTIKGNYATPKVSQGFNDLVSNFAKNDVVKATANGGSKILGGLGAGFSIYNSGQALNDKMQSIECFTEDSYNYAYYNNRSLDYSVPNSKCEIFSSNEYNGICRNNISIYSQEFEIAPGQYPDIGIVPWDSLSSESKAYMLGRFNSINGELSLKISRYYAGKGAIIP